MNGEVLVGLETEHKVFDWHIVFLIPDIMVVLRRNFLTIRVIMEGDKFGPAMLFFDGVPDYTPSFSSLMALLEYLDEYLFPVNYHKNN